MFRRILFLLAVPFAAVIAFSAAASAATPGRPFCSTCHSVDGW